VATGLYRNFTTTQDTQVVQAYVRYGLTNLLTPTIDLLAGPRYGNIGLQTNFNTAAGVFNFKTLFSHLYGENGQRGESHGIGYLTPNMKNISLALGTNYQTRYYTTPSTGLSTSTTASQVIFDTFKRSDFINFSFGLGSLGYLSLGALAQSSWASDVTTRQLQVGYGVTYKRVSLFASMNRTRYSDNRPRQESVGLSASIPLNLGSWPAYVRASVDQTLNNPIVESLSFNSSINGPSENNIDYGLTTTHSGGVSSSGVYASVQHPYGYASTSFTQGSTSQQRSLSLGGGLVAHSGGLIFAPTLGDTFAIVEVPHGKGAGVMGSPAQINRFGYGVVPYLSPYYLNDVQISLETASMGLEIDNPTQKVAPVDGSIVKLKYKSNAGRPVAFTFNLPNGERIPIGASVLDQDGQEIASLGQGNRALIRLQADEGVLSVVWGDEPGMQCEAKYKLDKVSNADREFTRVKLMCFKPEYTKEAMNKYMGSQVVKR
jgi:outer membrane usher protein